MNSDAQGETTGMYLSFKLFVLCFTLFMHKNKKESQAQQHRVFRHRGAVLQHLFHSANTWLFCHLSSSSGGVPKIHFSMKSNNEPQIKCPSLQIQFDHYKKSHIICFLNNLDLNNMLDYLHLHTTHLRDSSINSVVCQDKTNHSDLLM